MNRLTGIKDLYREILKHVDDRELLIHSIWLDTTNFIL